jgi:hypothetical protein
LTMQGFLFHRPVSLAAFMCVLEEEYPVPERAAAASRV